MLWIVLGIVLVAVVTVIAYLRWRFRDKAERCGSCKGGRLRYVDQEDILHHGRDAGLTTDQIISATLWKILLKCDRCGNLYWKPLTY